MKRQKTFKNGACVRKTQENHDNLPKARVKSLAFFFDTLSRKSKNIEFHKPGRLVEDVWKAIKVVEP